MANYGVGAAEYLASRNPHGTALSEHTEQAHILRVMLGVFRGHTGAVKLHSSFGNSHCTELTTSTFGSGVLWQPLNLEGNYKQLTAQLNPLQEFKQSPPEFLSWCGMSNLCTHCSGL